MTTLIILIITWLIWIPIGLKMNELIATTITNMLFFASMLGVLFGIKP
jgi:hypothetical protein